MKKFFPVVLFFFFISCDYIEKKQIEIGFDPSSLKISKEMTYHVEGFLEELLLEIAKEKNIKFFLTKKRESSLFKGLDSGSYEVLFSTKYPYIFDKAPRQTENSRKKHEQSELVRLLKGHYRQRPTVYDSPLIK